MLKYIGSQERMGGFFFARTQQMRDKIARLAIQYAVALDQLATTSELPVSVSDLTNLENLLVVVVIVRQNMARL